jgi:hypothetical protein
MTKLVIWSENPYKKKKKKTIIGWKIETDRERRRE